MRAVIVVPWRDKGDAWRRRNLDVVLGHLSSIDVAPVVVTSDGRFGSAPFNRSAAYNRAVREHTGVDVFVFYEADMIIRATQLIDAIDQALDRQGLVVPFTTYQYLSQVDTELVHTGRDPFSFRPEYEMANGRSIGAVNVVSAASMAAVGQWDERFEGWGFDDRAMARAFLVATNYATRYAAGTGIHLWHTPGWKAGGQFRGGSDVSDREHQATEANRHRYREYIQATTPQAVRRLTSGRCTKPVRSL